MRIPVGTEEKSVFEDESEKRERKKKRTIPSVCNQIFPTAVSPVHA